MSDYKNAHGKRKVIGASQVAAILGLGNYNTALDIFNHITGRTETTQTELMFRGVCLEPVLFEEVKSHFPGYTTHFKPDFIVHKTMDFFGCYPDAFIEKDGLVVAGLEFKVMSSDKNIDKYDDPTTWLLESQPDWYWQIQSMMLIGGQYFDLTHLPFYLFSLVDNGRDFHFIPPLDITPNFDDFKIIEKVCTKFWNEHILKDEPPVVDKVELDKTELGEFYEVEDSTIKNLIQKRMKLDETIKPLEKELETLDKDIKKILDDINYKVIISDDVKISQTLNQPRSYIAEDLLLAHLPPDFNLDNCKKQTKVNEKFKRTWRRQ